MKEKIIITSGRKYIDIDAYAGMIAYRELLKSLGYEVYAKSTAIENESISSIIKELGFSLDEIEIDDNDKFIILDVSNPDFFDNFVKLNNVVEVIDHHTGYEEYWKNHSQTKNSIEFIGSICTMIFERYIENDKISLLNQNLCKLLIAAILDNTLNLKASITTSRDKRAYQKLLKIGDIDDNWRYEYFSSCYKHVENNLKKFIENDIKIEEVSSYLPKVFGQLIVLNKDVIFNHLNEVYDLFFKYEQWILNIISLEDGKSYLFYSENFKSKLEHLFQKKSKNNYLILEQFLLRKQIMKLARNLDPKE